MKRVMSILLALVMVFATVPMAFANADTPAEAADILHELGVISGTGVDSNGNPVYELERPATRCEAVKLLITLLGKGDDALSGKWSTPFTDVPAWAEPYIGYAYTYGLTMGVSANQFGSSYVTASQYITFVLRALGYDSSTDFRWDRAWELSDRLGITGYRYNAHTGAFLRGDAMMVSEAALAAGIKNTEYTLADRLIKAGVFTESQYKNAYGGNVPGSGDGTEVKPLPEPGIKPDGGGKLSSEQIAEKCSPAVFYIEVTGLNGQLYKSGSGFFISSDGFAVTNYHVVSNASIIKIMTTDGSVYSDVRIVDADYDRDLALLKISGKKFPYLEQGNSDKLKQGQEMYAIGSPAGMSNTMSRGIVANPGRWIDGAELIQISVPITHGSSGGALIDEYGKVVGVTSSGLGDADLNFAVPVKYISSLNRNSGEDLILYGCDTYPGCSQIYDFGIFANLEVFDMENTYEGYRIYYDLDDFYDSEAGSYAENFADTIFYYFDALKSNGMKEVYIPQEYEDFESTGFEGDYEAALVSIDYYNGFIIIDVI